MLTIEIGQRCNKELSYVLTTGNFAFETREIAATEIAATPQFSAAVSEAFASAGASPTLAKLQALRRQHAGIVADLQKLTAEQAKTEQQKPGADSIGEQLALELCRIDGGKLDLTTRIAACRRGGEIIASQVRETEATARQELTAAYTQACGRVQSDAIKQMAQTRPQMEAAFMPLLEVHLVCDYVANLARARSGVTAAVEAMLNAAQ